MNKIKVCDTLWSEAIKKKAGHTCEHCGKTKHLQSHHIIPRTNYALRHDLENGVCLCLSCHLYWAHRDAIAFAQWISARRDMSYLESRRHSQTRNDYTLIRIYLENYGK